MDPAKVKVVTEGPQSDSFKQLQCFWGFVSFNCHFLHDFNSLTAHLTILPQALLCFLGLLKLTRRQNNFSHPHPGLTSPFVWDGHKQWCAGAILSWCYPKDESSHPKQAVMAMDISPPLLSLSLLREDHQQFCDQCPSFKQCSTYNSDNTKVKIQHLNRCADVQPVKYKTLIFRYPLNIKHFVKKV